MVSIDTLITKIIHFAQKLVDADRASLFLVDAKTKELYATIFDVGVESGAKTSISPDLNIANEIRFPLGIGVAGLVAMNGEILNITDAYSDPRFNRSVDQQTGKSNLFFATFWLELHYFFRLQNQNNPLHANIHPRLHYWSGPNGQQTRWLFHQAR